MKQFLTLIRREWWEWRRVILWTIGVFTFLMLLTLIPLNKLSNTIDDSLEEGQEIFSTKMFKSSNFNKDEMTEEEWEELSKSLRKNVLPDSVLYESKQATIDSLKENPMPVVKPYSYAILAGFSTIQMIILFIALFYFSDSLFKERSNSSTLFFRSQPLGDHKVLLSKLVSGTVGIIAVTIVMLIILLFYFRSALGVINENLWDILKAAISQIRMFDLFGDLVVFQSVAILWLSPLILFLMMVSSVVKNRPLIIGVGGPILLVIVLQIIFGNNVFTKQITEIFMEISVMAENQLILNKSDIVGGKGVEILGSFSGYLFSLRTIVSIAISAGFYWLTFIFYRKNISTN